MKFYNLPDATILAKDPKAMREAISFLEQAGIAAKRPSPYQLKLDEQTSYYPTKGTLFVDGEAGSRPARGMAALISWIEEG